ncbi:MAG: class I SAM-dependent methyltransferase [Aureispira sp.]
MIILNKYGFYELEQKPSEEDLKKYYEEKYYQDGSIATYRHEYPKEEKEYFNNKIAQKYQFLLDQKILEQETPYRLLDVGCGEGFTLNFFYEKGWDVVGLDYSNDGCKRFHPQCLDHFIEGDIYQELQQLIKSKEVYDLIWLDNVLEHVLDPLFLLQQLQSIVSAQGVLIIEVPNDFSVVQQHLYNKGTLKEQNWIAIPDHISYFNREGLRNICTTAGWENMEIIGDFPIDWFLFNEHSNYYQNKSTGKAAHQARVELENILHQTSPQKTLQLYKALADLGMGRQLIGFFKKG